MSASWYDFVERVELAGFSARKCSQSHWQITDSPLVVNVYPHTKRGMRAYVSGTKSGKSIRNFAEAIQMAKQPPPRGGYAHKRDRRKKGGYIREKRKLFKKSSACWVCRKELGFRSATLDHVIPLSRGGLDNLSNMALACKQCNKQRGSEMPEITKDKE